MRQWPGPQPWESSPDWQMGNDDEPWTVCAAAGTLSCLTRSMLPHRGQWATSP
ncbi:MAG TPA: hypothetical protein VKP69_06620 [Isosphaeraceae bacterium]|nr:hypothetical protein [Isosphaeraceae bacterium]